MQELSRLFLPTAANEGNGSRSWATLVSRYQGLVEKEFTVGLTPEEAEESERLDAEIDAAEVASAKARARAHFQRT